MKNILNKLLTLPVPAKTKKEKVLNWLSKYQLACLVALLSVGGVLSVVLLTFFILKHQHIPLSLLAATQLSVVVVMIFNHLINKNDKQQEENYKKEVFDYLKNNQEQKEVKELLMKIKWLAFYDELNSSNLKLYVNHVENDIINESNITQACKLITEKLTFFKDNEILLNKSVDELKTMFVKKLTNELQKEKDKIQKCDQIINSATNSDDLLFKKEKVLKANL